MTLLLSAQQSFDTFTYQMPDAYTVREAKEYRELSRIDQQRKFYCQLVLYRSQASLGSAQADLENEWKQAVLTSFKPKGASSDRPLPLPQAPESMVRASETTALNGTPSLTSLFVLRFGARYVGIIFNVPNTQAFEACQGDVAKLVQSVTYAAPASAPVQPSSILGSWEYLSASSTPMTYNMFTKRWEMNYAMAANQFRNLWRLTFEAGGRYTRDITGLDINRQQDTRAIEKGTFAVAGDRLQLKPAECSQGRAEKGKPVPLEACKVAAPYEYRFVLGPRPNSEDKTPGLQLLDKDGSWTSYKPVH